MTQLPSYIVILISALFRISGNLFCSFFQVADQADCDVRDYGKKVHGFEIEFDETLDKLNKAIAAYEEKDKSHREVEADIAALSRRIMLMEEEAKKAETTLATTVTKLAISSKEADEILKKVKVVER